MFIESVRILISLQCEHFNFNFPKNQIIFQIQIKLNQIKERLGCQRTSLRLIHI